MATQTLFDEAYGAGAKTNIDISGTLTKNQILGTAASGSTAATTGITTSTKILELAELTGKGSIEDVEITKGSVSKLVWKSNTYTKNCTYENRAYTVAE